MASIERAITVCVSVWLLIGPAAQPKQLVNQKTYYAAIFLNRGHVSGGALSNIGLFARRHGDTAWQNIYHRNLFAFGLGFSGHGATRHYYIAAGNGLHRSTDAGNSWRVLTGWTTEEVLSVAIDPDDPRTLFIATPFGIFRSRDDGERWERTMRGMKKWYVQEIVIDWRDHQTLYAAAEDDLYRSSDSGGSWKPLGVGARGILSVLQHPGQASTLLVGTEDNGVQLSTDGGRSWKGGQGLPQTAFYALRSSRDGSKLYAGGYQTGLWMSGDSGRTWSLIWRDPEVEAIYSILVDPENSQHLLVGTCGQGVYESHDGGATWVNAGLRGAHVKQIELYP